MTAAELKKLFGKRVQGLREAAGLTQEQLAERIARSIDTVSNIERGVNATRIEVAYQIATELGVTMPQLFAFDGDRRAVSNDREQRTQAVTSMLQGADDATLAKITDLVRVGLSLAGKVP